MNKNSTKASVEQITADRKEKENPYAHIDGEDNYSALQLNQADRVAESRRKLENPYAHLDEDGKYSVATQNSKLEANSNLIRLSDFRNPDSLGKRLSIQEIDTIVKALLQQIWKNRKSLFCTGKAVDPTQMLDPIVVLKALGYDVSSVAGLGQHDDGSGVNEVAGYIDSSKKIVGISHRFPPAVRNFTAAHELGHAVLHKAVGFHRDRALDGGNASGPRKREEIEANKFASLFLMPENLVKSEFQKRFLTEHFTIEDDSAFLLAGSSTDELKKKVKNTHHLARMLAESERYHTNFKSMKSLFNVSTIAMAIRLEELNLLSPIS